MESSDELCTPCKAAMFDKMRALVGEAPASSVSASHISAAPADRKVFPMPTDAVSMPQADFTVGREKPCLAGFGFALACALVALVALACGWYGLDFAVKFAYSGDYGWQAMAEAVYAALFLAVSLGFGGAAIASVIRARRARRKMPVVTVILSGIGAVLTSITLVLEILTVLITA